MQNNKYFQDIKLLSRKKNYILLEIQRGYCKLEYAFSRKKEVILLLYFIGDDDCTCLQEKAFLFFDRSFKISPTELGKVVIYKKTRQEKLQTT